MSSPEFPNSSTDADTSGGVLPAKAEASLRHDVEAAVETARDEFGKIKDEAANQASVFVDEAKSQLADATEKAKGLAAEQKDLLAGQISGVADAMERVATDLEGQNASSAHYARMIADGATRISDTVKNNDVDTILAMAQDFGRRQPGAFIGAAALLGFAASRFVLASAKRENQRGAGTESAPSVDYNGLPQVDRPVGYDTGNGVDDPSNGRV